MKPKSGRKFKKNPWIAALLNFLFWGGGYIYNGKQKQYGLLLVTIWAALNFFTAKYLESMSIAGLVYLLVLLMGSVSFAVSGYQESKKI